MMRAGHIAANIGQGLFAGFVGTLAITGSQMVEMTLTERQPSSAPADAAGKVLGVQPTGEDEKQRFAQIVHFGYGTSWGAVRGLMASMGLNGVPATLAFFAAVWATELLMLPALIDSPPVTEWDAKTIAIDAGHHFVYAAAAGTAFERMNGRD